MSRLPLKTAWPPRFSSSASTKNFPFPLVTFVQVLCYPHRPKGFIKRSYINNFKTSVAIVLGDNVSLDFITFTVPKEIKKDIIYLFYNLRICLKRG